MLCPDMISRLRLVQIAMLKALLAFGAVLIAFAGGWITSALRPRRNTKRLCRSTPLDHDEYLSRSERLDRAYTESIKEYDRLVTWGSGGALALSVTFIERYGSPTAQVGSLRLLGAGWIALGAALLLSLWSQYFSSR